MFLERGFDLGGLRCTIFPVKPGPARGGWRLTLPRAAKVLLPRDEDASKVFLLIVDGYVELWFPETLRNAMATPISQLLP